MHSVWSIAFAPSNRYKSSDLCVRMHNCTETEAGPSRGQAVATVVATDSIKCGDNRCVNKSIVSRRP